MLHLVDVLLQAISDACCFGLPSCSASPSVPYAALAHCFQKIESTTKRLLMTEYLTEFLVLVVARAAPAQAKGEAEKILEKGKKAPVLSSQGATGAQSLLTVIYLCINRVRSVVVKLRTVSLRAS